MHKHYLPWIIVGLVVVGAVIYAVAAVQNKEPNVADDGGGIVPGHALCTMEAKLCPDGSSVGRTGPNCEFAPCPGEPTPEPVPAPSPNPY